MQGRVCPSLCVFATMALLLAMPTTTVGRPCTVMPSTGESDVVHLMCVRVCIACMCLRVHVRMCTRVKLRLCMRCAYTVHVRVHVRVHACVHARLHVRVHARVHARVNVR